MYLYDQTNWFARGIYRVSSKLRERFLESGAECACASAANALAAASLAAASAANAFANASAAKRALSVGCVGCTK